jgi:hypothetical protein
MHTFVLRPLIGIALYDANETDDGILTAKDVAMLDLRGTQLTAFASVNRQDLHRVRSRSQPKAQADPENVRDWRCPMATSRTRGGFSCNEQCLKGTAFRRCSPILANKSSPL